MPLPALPAPLVTTVFLVLLLASLMLQIVLLSRQMRHVARHRSVVPAAFAAQVPLQAHHKAADYTLAKARIGVWAIAFEHAVLLGWTLLGGLEALNNMVYAHTYLAHGAMAYQLALLGSFVAISGLIALPWSVWQTFVLEARFGFNCTTLGVFLADQIKGAAVLLVLGTPLAALVLWLMAAAGPWWWAWAFAAWAGFNLLLMVLFPLVIAPLFNRFEPLHDAALQARLHALMARTGFALRGLFVMDGSRRSSHGNAYFTGFGAGRRVVLFDTLLAQLQPQEIEAVLAHEVGHFKRRHLPRRLAAAFALSAVGFALLGGLATQPGFYVGLGVVPSLAAPNDALALLLFVLVAPLLTFLLAPLAHGVSRRHEFEADAFARRHADGSALASALVKLTRESAGTLTPDPLYARWHYSHPPTAERVAALQA